MHHFKSRKCFILTMTLFGVVLFPFVGFSTPNFYCDKVYKEFFGIPPKFSPSELAVSKDFIQTLRKIAKTKNYPESKIEEQAHKFIATTKDHLISSGVKLEVLNYLADPVTMQKIWILPDDSTSLGRFAQYVQDEFGLKLLFDPYVLFNYRALASVHLDRLQGGVNISIDAVMRLALASSEAHELVHALHAKLEMQGKDTIFSGEVTFIRSDDEETDTSLDDPDTKMSYGLYLSFDEIAAFAVTIQELSRELPIVSQRGGSAVKTFKMIDARARDSRRLVKRSIEFLREARKQVPKAGFSLSPGTTGRFGINVEIQLEKYKYSSFFLDSKLTGVVGEMLVNSKNALSLAAVELSRYAVENKFKGKFEFLDAEAASAKAPLSLKPPVEGVAVLLKDELGREGTVFLSGQERPGFYRQYMQMIRDNERKQKMVNDFLRAFMDKQIAAFEKFDLLYKDISNFAKIHDIRGVTHASEAVTAQAFSYFPNFSR